MNCKPCVALRAACHAKVALLFAVFWVSAGAREWRERASKYDRVSSRIKKHFYEPFLDSFSFRRESEWAFARHQPIAIRLSEGAHGTLQVSHAGEFKAVCHDHQDFPLTAAIVACRQIGMPGGAILHKGALADAVGTRAMRLTGLRCHGDEPNLDQCDRQDLEVKRCFTLVQFSCPPALEEERVQRLDAERRASTGETNAANLKLEIADLKQETAVLRSRTQQEVDKAYARSKFSADTEGTFELRSTHEELAKLKVEMDAEVTRLQAAVAETYAKGFNFENATAWARTLAHELAALRQVLQEVLIGQNRAKATVDQGLQQVGEDAQEKAALFENETCWQGKSSKENSIQRDRTQETGAGSRGVDAATSDHEHPANRTETHIEDARPTQTATTGVMGQLFIVVLLLVLALQAYYWRKRYLDPNHDYEDLHSESKDMISVKGVIGHLGQDFSHTIYDIEKQGEKVRIIKIQCPGVDHCDVSIEVIFNGCIVVIRRSESEGIAGADSRQQFQFKLSDGLFEFKEDQFQLEQGILQLVFRRYQFQKRIVKFPEHFCMDASDLDRCYEYPAEVEDQRGEQRLDSESGPAEISLPCGPPEMHSESISGLRGADGVDGRGNTHVEETVEYTMDPREPDAHAPEFTSSGSKSEQFEKLSAASCSSSSFEKVEFSNN